MINVWKDMKNPPRSSDIKISLRDNVSWKEKIVEEFREKPTIRNADEILVVSENGITERGTHEQLLKQGGIYAHYYEMT